MREAVQQPALFAYDGSKFDEIRDYTFLAPDRPAYQCVGRPLLIKGRHGESVTKWSCGRMLPDLCYVYVARGSRRARPVRPRCIACEQEIREARKRLWIFLTKARTALGHHMTRERVQGLHAIRTLREYEVITGLSAELLADTMEQAAINDLPCPHCEVRWSAMRGGWEMQMSLDRTDAKRMLALDNFTLKCRTGNSQRQDTEPRTAAVRDSYWRLIRRERASAVA